MVWVFRLMDLIIKYCHHHLSLNKEESPHCLL
ncbi:hypothetical protein MG5_00493 [Candida albicans P57072]|uniref:Uncharacterized protein n=1 Tax=Candida albicans P78048 TaxID=1094989 RepID=A0AB34PZW3_CANAX|nr:hypothetical protein MEO_00500 [Candida albicans P94015]KGQ98903.1 hypothetical protein MEU_00499 [Candida albicans P37005]KGR03720.1 hypothetical protein MG1_00502 [Candida albicans GC75]KGR15640.1 hypothetical protein MG5_00493 [Candida albicans P57072]KGR21540.1 hypothetical protein MG3_00543 [Candida albicans P78048]KGR23567.1 hypothetical protein MG9_00502 [Candida albicans P37037]KGT71967.1 hypothetical protein MEK_00510 [Candida albicans 12C]KGU14851.1 hypothetical protein MEQ_0049